MRTTTAALAAACLLLAACTSDDDADDAVAEFDDEFDDEFADDEFDDEFADDEFDDEFADDEESMEGEPAGEPSGGAAPAGAVELDDDLYLVDHGAGFSGDVITIPVQEGDTSVSITFVGADPDDGMFVVEATDPSGANIIPPDAEPFNNGEVTFVWPYYDDQPLTPGEHSFVIESAGEITQVYSVHKTSAPDAQVLDVRFWVTATSDAVAPDRWPELTDRFREVGDRIFASQGLGVGEIEFIAPPPDAVEEFSEIELPSSGNDAEHRRLCGAMSDALEPARAVNFAIVDRVIDEEDPDGETEGNAAGLPGAPPVEGSITSCVLMIADGSRDIADLGVVVWHEAGHLLGLFHTTEQSGDSFDIIDDTPECVLDEFDDDGDGIVIAEECPDGENFMFYDTDELVLTDQQGFVLRMHPLFRAAG